VSEITRRRLLAAGSAGAAGLALGGGGYALGRDGGSGEGHAAETDRVAFYDPHQAGITTPAQDRLVFGAFDLTLEHPGELRELLQAWTAAAATMTAGHPTGAVAGNLDAPPTDTGEAAGLGAAQLTITFGLGRSRTAGAPTG
jgi:deferrochelatase/peroxidase EfeB